MIDTPAPKGGRTTDQEIVMTNTGRTARPARTATKKATVTPTIEAPVEIPATEAPVEIPAVEAPVETPATPTGPTLTIGAVTVQLTDTTALIAAYAAASVGDKTKARNAVTAGMGAAVMAANLPAAQLWMAAQTALASVSAAKATPEIDYTQVVIDRAIGLAYAAKRLGYGDLTPDGIDADKIDTARVEKAFRDYMSGDMDAVTDAQGKIADAAAKAKITRSVKRGSVEAHIEAAFAGTSVGTRLTVAQIRTASGAASDGAIAARVWPVDAKTKAAKESSLDFAAMGIRPCLIDGVRGMEKFADVATATETA